MNHKIEQAKLFRQLHVSNSPLLLPNAWDVSSAKAIEASGVCAIATSSWAVAHAYGYEDGEKIPLEWVLDNVCRIKNSVNCPVTLDIEAGYSKTPEGVKQTIKAVIETGVVGINIEDQNLDDANACLYSVDDQVKRIVYARQAAEEQSVPLFINARTDVFFKLSEKSDQEKLDEVMTRAHAYATAGADGLFVPGLTDKALIEVLCQHSPLPVNLMATTFDRDVLNFYKSTGVSRISFGPLLYIHMLSELSDLGKRILDE